MKVNISPKEFNKMFNAVRNLAESRGKNIVDEELKNEKRDVYLLFCDSTSSQWEHLTNLTKEEYDKVSYDLSDEDEE